MAEQKDKPIQEWTVEETMSYLRSAIGDENRNKQKLFMAIQVLASKLGDNDAIIQILKDHGIDLIFDLIADTMNIDNANLQKGLCTHLIVLCSAPESKQYPATKNQFNALAEQTKKYVADKDLCNYVCNALCNVCHNNDAHRDFAIQSNVVDAIVLAMDTHRGQADGEKVHESGCMALRNIGSTEQGQAAVGPKGLKAITDGVEHYFDTANIVKSSLGVLCNLCVLGTNGKWFIEAGKLELWTKIYDSAANQYPIRLGCAAMIHNLASKVEACSLLGVNEVGLKLVIGKMLNDAPHDSALFANTLKAVAALMFTLPQNKQLKVECMNKMIDAGVLQIFNKTLKDSKNRELEELIATIVVSMVQTSIPLAQRVADGDTPEYLVGCLNDPTPQTLHCCMSTWFYVTDNYKNQQQLIKAGLLEFLCSPWYQQYVQTDTIRIGLSLALKLVQNTKNYDAFRPFCQKYDAMADFCEKKSGDIAKQCKSLKEDINSVRKGGL